MDALLAPWLARAALSLAIDALPTPRELRERLWVDVALARGDGDRSRWTQQFEALELLALAVRADAHAAWTALLATQGQRAYADAIVAAQTPLRFRLTVHSSVYADDATFTALRDALLQLVNNDGLHQSAELTRAKSELQELMSARGDLMDKGEEGAFRVALCLKQHEHDVPFEREDRPDMLSRLVELAETIRAHETTVSSSSPLCCFRWTHVALNCQNTETLDVLYGHVDRLLECGLQVELLTIVQRARLVDAGAAARFWTRSLAARGIQSLTLSPAMDMGAFQGLCSAIAGTEIPLEVSYWPQHGHNGELDAVSHWMWLALALFRPTVRRDELRVVLDLSGVTLEEARAVERVVRARDPIAILRCLDDTEPVEDAPVHHTVQIRPGTRVSIGDGPTSTNRAEFLISADEVPAVRVIDDVSSDSHVGVWWPGAGIGWVHAADILGRFEAPQLHPAAGSRVEATCVIDHLSLRFSSTTSIQAAEVLLRTVGAGVRRLTLQCEFSRLDDKRDAGFWSNVLRVCPVLERLDLTYVAVDSLNWLLEAASSLTTCQLRVLSLDGVYLEDTARCLGDLFAALADRDHALSQSVREFHTQWVTVEPRLDELLAMLTANRSLEKCVLSTETDPSEWHEMRISEFVDQSVMPMPSHVERRRRMAFLSVFRARLDSETDGETPPVTCSLDEYALSLVLAFDATKRRQCDVVYGEW